jgi:hypothetical protein
MATLYAAETAVLGTTPPGKLEGKNQGADVVCYASTITLATQTTSDTIVLAQVPENMRFAYGVLNSTVTLGSSTVAIGIAGATGKYRAAAVFTAVQTPTLFGVVAAMNGATAAGGETIFITIAAANFPASGTLDVQLYFYKA